MHEPVLPNPSLSEYRIVCSYRATNCKAKPVSCNHKASGRRRRAESSTTSHQSHQYVHCLFALALLLDVAVFFANSEYAFGIFFLRFSIL